jgi:PAS domain S-box-containing protein
VRIHTQEDQLAFGSLIAEHAADAIFLLDTEGRTTYANPAAEEMFGWSQDELRDKTLHSVLHYRHPDGRHFPMEECPLGEVLKTGGSLKLHDDVFFRRDGTAVPVTCSNAAYRRNGEFAGGVLIVRDVTDRRIAEEQTQLLLQELSHRVKNNLAVVQSIAQQTFRSPSESEDRDKFDKRLQALATAHGLLATGQWLDAELEQVIRGALQPFDSTGARIKLEGPRLKVPASAALALSLVVHELATNAAKYGALSSDDGTISVSWFVSGGGTRRLRLLWSEGGGPPVAAPQRTGFGSRMIKRGLASALGGTAELRFEPAGLQVIVDAPALAPVGDEPG